jgi:hypothetical protein
MDIVQISEIFDWLAPTSICELEFNTPQTHLRLRTTFSFFTGSRDAPRHGPGTAGGRSCGPKIVCCKGAMRRRFPASPPSAQ